MTTPLDPARLLAEAEPHLDGCDVMVYPQFGSPGADWPPVQRLAEAAPALARRCIALEAAARRVLALTAADFDEDQEAAFDALRSALGEEDR